LLSSSTTVTSLTNDKASEQGKEDAAQTLSNLAQTPFPAQTHLPVQQHPYPGLQQPGGGVPGINDPGPSSHPRGPPNLGQLSNVAVSAPPTQAPRQLPPQAQEVEEGDSQSPSAPKDASPGLSTGTTGTRRGGRSATMGSDEWTRQRKDNHASVCSRLS
jgi:transcriptional regulator CBF1